MSLLNATLVFLLFFASFGVSNAGSVDLAAERSNLVPPGIRQDPLGVAYYCLSALASDGKGASSTSKAMNAGNLLESLLTKDKKGLSGWPYNQGETEKSKKCGNAGALDAFSDGTCNPPQTPYMIQTGYAVTCLAQLHLVTGESRYLNLAKKVLSDSWNLGTSLPGCKDCFYYWYSYHSNDLNRYVRNTNLIMGLGIAWMYAATGDPAYYDRALAIARAEDREIKAGNFGYFGIDDPRYRAKPKLESQRIENHIPHQVKALKDIGTLLHDAQATKNSKIMLDAFLNCRNERCKPDNCKSWAAPISCKATATIAPCILADQGEPYKSRCEAVIKELPRLNAFQSFIFKSNQTEKLELR